MGQHFQVENLGSCPSDHSGTLNIDYPSTTVLSFLLFLLCFLTAVALEMKYNSFLIFGAKRRTATVSNTQWIFFYFSSSLAYLFTSLEIGSTTGDDNGYVFVSFLFHGFAGLFLSLALNHQLKYRSRGSQPIVAKPKNQQKGWFRYWRRELFGSIPTLCWILFAYFVAALFYQRVKDDEDISFGILICMFTLQRVPVVVLSYLIIQTVDVDGVGPSYTSRIILSVGILAYLSTCLPVLLWAEFIPDSCPFSIASWVDLLLVFHLISEFLILWVVRKEYIRNQEACIWASVSQTQTFDIRPF